MAWLERTPQCIVHAHLEMLPRLEAEESLVSAHATAIGGAMAGSKRREWMGAQLRAWRELARRGQQVVKATAETLRAAGIAMKVVPRG